MLLLTEQSFDRLEVLTESDQASGEKRLYIEGVFLQANVKNRNGRIYEDRILKPVIEKYISDQVKPGRALGECMHPQSPSINLDRVSHRITQLEWNKNDVIGKALVLNTPMGNIVRGLLDGGTQLGVSSRGIGSLVKKKDGEYVNEDFMLSTIDVVADPSAPRAFVNGILEGVEFELDENGKLVLNTQTKKIRTKTPNLTKRFSVLESFIRSL